MKLLILALALVAFVVTGCGRKEAAHDGHDHDAHPHDAPALDFEGLGAADAALARAQGDCPVSDEPLGSMGTPIKVESEGRVVFLCCEGCRKKFERDPEKYLAKLGG